MNMRLDGEQLIEGAQRIFDRDVHGALQDNDYNIVVRRAQEVVELCLKGALRSFGVDYPKVHDVAPVFSEQARLKAAKPVDDAILDRIETISLWLGQARTRSFYLEQSYSETDAVRASTDASYVLTEVRRVLSSPSESATLENESPEK